MLANREGLFHGYPVEIGLGETQQNKLLQVVILYRLSEELVRGEWVDIAAEGLEITGYHILEKRDHTLNETTIESLKAALGWDGRDPFWLQDQLRDWQKSHRWHPHQLRHTYATQVRKEFGLEAAQILLGHAKADVTQVYAERDLSRAAAVIHKIG